MKIVELANRLNQAMSQGAGNDVLGGIFGELKQYTVDHFGTEEALFDQYGYPETEGHKEIHADLLEKVGELEEDFRHGRVAMSAEIMQFLRDWLQKHIKGVDMRYTDFLRDALGI